MAKRMSLYLKPEELLKLDYIEKTLKINWRDFVKDKINKQYNELKKYSVNGKYR